MAQNRFQANFKLREDLFDSITPKFCLNKEVDASVGSYKPAAWLPVIFTKSNYQAGTDAFVIGAWKPVALDTTGRVVPAGMRIALGGTGSTGPFAGTVLSYTTTDEDWGVVDLVTGERVTGAVSYTGEALAGALIERGLVRDADAVAAGATIPVAADADVVIVIDLFISHAVGVVVQDVNVWSGLPEDGDQFFTNYSRQSGVAFWTKATLQCPQRVAGEETSDDFDAFTLDAGGSTAFVAGAFIAAGEYWDITNLIQLNRYSALSATQPVVAIGLLRTPVATNTARTPVSCDIDGVLVRERSSIELVSREGDWYWDADAGVIFLHTDTWATLVALGSAATTLSYSYYTNTGTATEQRFPYFDGPCRPGDWVTYDAKSNFTFASSTVVGTGLAVGRVHRIAVEPRDLLQNVKTQSTLSNATKVSKMPGSATLGFSDLITLPDETVADHVVHVKFEV